MIVRLASGRVIEVTKQQGEAIKRLIESRADYIQLPDDTMVNTKSIMEIGNGSIDYAKTPHNALAEGRRIATDEGIAKAKAALKEKIRIAREKKKS